MPPNRIVALFTPVVAVAAGAVATWLADNVGLHVSEGELQAVFIAGIAAVLAPSAQWLHGFQKYEAHQQVLDQAAQAADEQAVAVAEDDFEPEDAYEDHIDADFEDAEPGDEYEDDEPYEDDYEAARDEAVELEPAGA
jgi:hypothetical protein